MDILARDLSISIVFKKINFFYVVCMRVLFEFLEANAWLIFFPNKNIEGYEFSSEYSFG